MADPAWLTADWPAPENIRAFTTLRSGPGVSSPPFDRFNFGLNSGDALPAVIENRRRLADLAQLPGELYWLQQVHGTVVADIDALLLGGGIDPSTAEDRTAASPMADASRTTRPDAVLAILTADCLPLLLCNSRGTEIAAAHAGWRGLAAGVLEATVRTMRSTPGDLLAWLGPAAGPQAYEIGAEVRAAFVARDARAESAFTATRPDHWRVDLYSLARMRLAEAGVTRVYGDGLCTISDPARFFSHRRDGRSGRMASLIWIKG